MTDRLTDQPANQQNKQADMMGHREVTVPTSGWKICQIVEYARLPHKYMINPRGLRIKTFWINKIKIHEPFKNVFIRSKKCVNF